MFTLIDVIEITARPEEGVYSMIIRFDLDGELMEGPFGYRPEDAAESTAQIKQWLIDHEGEYTVLPYVEPPPAPYELQIATLWDRMTDDEAEEFDAAVSTASPLKTRKQFQLAVSMTSDSDLFVWTKALLATLFGDARAAVLVAA